MQTVRVCLPIAFPFLLRADIRCYYLQEGVQGKQEQGALHGCWQITRLMMMMMRPALLLPCPLGMVLSLLCAKWQACLHFCFKPSMPKPSDVWLWYLGCTLL